MPSLRESLLAIINHATRRLDYLALYPATVNKQNADGTLELTPDDTRLVGLSKVPIRLGVPGITVIVKADSRVLLGFAGGSPKLPIATLWEASSVEQIDVVADKVHVVSPDVRLGTASAADAVALAPSSDDGLSDLHSRLASIEALIRGAPIPEPGFGAPSALQIALLAAIGPIPSTAPSSVAATKVKAV